jgi:hypothetical protein
MPFMRMFLATIIAGGMLCSLSPAQAAPSAQTGAAAPQAQQTQGQPVEPGQAAKAPRIAAGSVIPVQLTKTIDAKKVKAGEEVDVKVTQDMKAENGQILMPKDTKIVGHVTEAQARTKEQKESQLGITFDHAVLKEGGNMPLPASIQAVIVPPSQNPENANAGGGGMAAPSAVPGGGSAPGGRSGMGGTPQQPAPSSYPTGNNQPNSSESNNAPATNANQPITAKTQGIVGVSNYKLSTPGDVTQGSVVSSEKSNVKLESGTVLLLRVNQ